MGGTVCYAVTVFSCRFYDKAHKIDALEFFKRFAVSAEELPDTVSSTVYDVAMLQQTNQL